MNQRQGSKPISAARRRAYDILYRVEAEQAYASVLLAAISDSKLSREDRALTQEIVLGVLRRRRLLDYFVERYTGRSIEQLDLPVVIALRIGLYQIRYLARIPRSAAVNESVNLVKRARVASAAGLVNAVLRNAAARLGEAAGEDITDPLERASVELSHPDWMLRRWRVMLGEEDALRLALANNSPPPTAFRVNTLRARGDEVLAYLKARDVSARESEVAAGAFVLESGSAANVNEAAREGLIYIQDEASQLVSILLDPRPGHRLLDLCAAPGSKSSHIAALADDKAQIIACDLHHHRLAAVIATCQRLGIKSIDALTLDATRELPFTEAPRFDRVLVDAPCSGTGTLRGNPEIKWRLFPDDIIRLADLQLDMLKQAANTVASGGRLVYSTCSIEPEENEEVIRRFLEWSPTFRVIKPSAHFDLITAEGFVRTFPHRHGTDGFFVAVLEQQ
ncbi:MAG TPA: 16S rRNA (cytosine(967)-C(5))-methyltransferase RsmB [Blastocatellia bacterium]|nr:16S rRNA (cytosine(967)-C(5))-methyltransferase RsmB [Blastocatellia bacterium]